MWVLLIISFIVIQVQHLTAVHLGVVSFSTDDHLFHLLSYVHFKIYELYSWV